MTMDRGLADRIARLTPIVEAATKAQALRLARAIARDLAGERNLVTLSEVRAHARALGGEGIPDDVWAHVFDDEAAWARIGTRAGEALWAMR